MLTKLIATAAITAATVTAACGNDDSSKKPTRHPHAAAVVEAWMHDIAAGDSGLACGRLNDAGKLDFARVVGLDDEMLVSSDVLCPTLAGEYSRSLDAARREQYARARVVRTSADKAGLVEVADQDIRYDGRRDDRRDDPFIVRRTADGAWLIEDLG